MKSYADIRSLEFIPLSGIKARLSEYIRRLAPGRKRIVVTTNGKPEAVLLSYEDYLALLGSDTTESATQRPVRTISYEDWRRDSKKRKSISKSIGDLFDVGELNRKGQKSYKRETVRAFGKNA